MDPVALIAKFIVALAIIYLFVLGIIAIARPKLAWRFLSGFASTPQANALEAVIRAIIGVAVMVEAGSFRFAAFFFVFGAFLTVSAIAMLFMYRQHRSFAQKVVPPLKRLLWLYGLASIGLGIVLWRLWSPAY
ncbi:hypothetical protein [Parvularcula lutaonensis]|uniref:MAPEG family protein n=1 Tax=Parvularcula lutaonensis TaxID=491923 RepID=A0ABV7MEB0_9PROT|nr:hypothetical protein [Parvularcula lutaonensis]GGY51191.1 hypothetical protein GCM10007148_20080 [Parvularcula lutaonensis]